MILIIVIPFKSLIVIPPKTWLPFQLIAKHDCHPTHPLHPVFTMVLPLRCWTDWWRPKTSLGMQPLPSSHTRLTPLIRSEWFCKITKFGDFCFDNETICQGEWFDCDHGSWSWLTFTWKISLWTQPLPSRGACSNPSAIDKTRKKQVGSNVWSGLIGIRPNKVNVDANKAIALIFSLHINGSSCLVLRAEEKSVVNLKSSRWVTSNKMMPWSNDCDTQISQDHEAPTLDRFEPVWECPCLEYASLLRNLHNSCYEPWASW